MEPARLSQTPAPGDDATVDVRIAATGHLIHAAQARSVDDALPGLLRTAMEKASAVGHGRDSYAGLIEVPRPAPKG
ncbi:hypothetical protein ABTZ58_06425 [Streptomyces sp. NPDC094143]|uniref:imine reductase family protein n=1 Tax=Streptomyces sp. NPDC094143 TaxID=3155310 RepID=UPI00332827A9